jgi:hypothetical protein
MEITNLKEILALERQNLRERGRGTKLSAAEEKRDGGRFVNRESFLKNPIHASS